MNRCVVAESGAPPHNKSRIFPPSKLRTFRKINLEKLSEKSQNFKAEWNHLDLSPNFDSKCLIHGYTSNSRDSLNYYLNLNL